MESWTQGQCDSNGLSLRYFRSGGDLPPLVLVHGFTDNALYYSRLANRLSATWDVVAYDARGHGQSDRAGGVFNDDARVGDLLCVVNSLGLDRPVLVGHSMGAATIALAVAETPAVSRAIVLEDPAWWELPVGSPEDRKTIQHARAERNGVWRADIERVQHGTWDEGMAWRRRDVAGWSDEDIALSLTSRLEVELDLFTYYPQAQAPWRDSVRTWACPALLVLGDNARGAIVTVEQAEEARRLNSLVHYARIANTGHAVRYEQFDAFYRAVTEFLGALSA